MTTVNRTLVCFIALSIVFLPGLAAAQGIQGGFQGGVTFSNLSNLTDAIDFGGPVDVNNRTGVVVGPFVAFPINETVALQVEALYATKGATPTDGTNELKIRLAYLDLPVLVRLSVPSTRRFYFLVGPSVNFNVSAETIDAIPAGAKEDIKDQIHDAEFGLVFGGGVSLRPFLVEARYSAGLTDISDVPEITATVRNRAFAILVGVRF
jgi:hypothetical protein